MPVLLSLALATLPACGPGEDAPSGDVTGQDGTADCTACDTLGEAVGLMLAIDRFIGGAPQRDDYTLVTIKRF